MVGVLDEEVDRVFGLVLVDREGGDQPVVVGADVADLVGGQRLLDEMVVAAGEPGHREGSARQLRPDRRVHGARPQFVARLWHRAGATRREEV